MGGRGGGQKEASSGDTMEASQETQENKKPQPPGPNVLGRQGIGSELLKGDQSRGEAGREKDG